MNHNRLGKLGEEKAQEYLKSSGYKILETNFKNDLGKRMGEIDIIARDKKTKELVFVEVKTRKESSGDSPLPEENITASKIHKLDKIIQIYIKRNDLWKEKTRLDAICISIDLFKGKFSIKHLKYIHL